MRDLKRKLDAVRDPGFTVTVDADTGEARKETTAFRKEEERKPIEPAVELEFGRARAEMARFRATQEANPVKIRVEIDKQKFHGDLSAMSHTLAEFRRTNVAVVGIAALGASGIGPAALGLANLADALQQVAQAGLAVPGVIAGVSASIGTLVLGLSGIGGAWKAAEQDAQSSGRTQAEAAKQAASAQNSLRNAVVDHAEAQKDLNRAIHDAKQELQDLRIEQRGGIIDESRAILSAQQARERLRKGDYTDLRDAVLDVQEADQSLLETRNRNAQTQDKLNDANRKGIQGNDNVVSANERLIRSNQQITDATNALTDAMNKTSPAADKFAQAMAGLSPAAQNLVNTFIRLKPEFQNFRSSISQPLLEGKAEEFEHFFRDIVPIIKPGMQRIATAWNQGMSKVLGALGTDENKGLIERILGNTANAQSRLNDALTPLINAMGILTAAGSDALPRMADAIVTMSDRFEAFIRKADESGELKQWIDEGLDALGNLSESILNIGKVFTDITSAAGGGGSFLEWLHKATGDLHTFLSSTEGQIALRDFFAKAREEIEKWKPIVENLPEVIGGLVSGLQDFSETVLPPLRDISKFLGEHPKLVRAAADAFALFVTGRGIVSGLNLIRDAVKGIGTALGAAEIVGLGTVAAGGAGKKVTLPLALRGGPIATLLLALGWTILYGDVPGQVAPGTPVPSAAQPGLFPPGPPQQQVPGAPPLPPTAAQPGLFPQPSTGPAGTGPGQQPFEVAPRGPGGEPTLPTTNVRAGDLKPGDPVPPGYYWIRGQLFHDGQPVDPNEQISTSAFLPAPQRPAAPRQYVRDLHSGDPLPSGYYWTPEGVRDSFGRLQERDTLLPAIQPLAPPGRAYGGPTPDKRGPGPTGGFVVELHGGEWVLPAPARAAIGDRRLARWTRGVMPGFQTGGPIDPNELLRDMGLGPLAPAPVAPNPYGGGTGDILGKIGQGAAGAISKGINLGSSLGSAAAQSASGFAGATAEGTVSGGFAGAAGEASVTAGAPGAPGGWFAPSAPSAPIAPVAPPSPGQALGSSFLNSIFPGMGNLMGTGTQSSGQTGITPGLWGLGQIGSMTPEMQGAALQAWGQQTGDWLGQFGAHTLTSFAGTLLGTEGGGGLLGGLGLGGLLSSPYAQAAKATLSHFTSLIPAGQQQGMGQISPEVWAEIQANPAALAALQPSTYAATGNTANSAALSSLSPAAQQAIQYAQTHAVGQNYVYGAAGPTSFDCSGIASAIYNAASGKNVRFTTDSDFAALGFLPGYQAGALNIGTNAGSGENGHMAVTLPNGVKVESSSSKGTNYGGPAIGAQDFTIQWHLPLGGADWEQDLPQTVVNPPAAGSALNWGALVDREASGNWANTRNPKYSGGLQFDAPTWAQYGGDKYAPTAAQATPAEQMAVGQRAIADRGGPQTLWPQNWQQLYTHQYGGPVGYQHGGPFGTADPNFDWGPGNYRGSENPPIWMIPAEQPDPRHPTRFLPRQPGGGFVNPGTGYPTPPSLGGGVLGPGSRGGKGKMPRRQYGGPIPGFQFGGGVGGNPYVPQSRFMRALVPTPPPRPPDARQIVPRPTPQPQRPALPQVPTPSPAPAPTPAPTPPPTAQPPTPAPPAPQLPTTAPGIGRAQAPYVGAVAGAPEEASPVHTLPWIDKAIDSGAQALGQALATAMGIAGAGAGLVGGAALGAAAPYAAGLVMQGGKIVKGLANVVSSSLVGSVPGSYMKTDEAYGKTMQPAARELQTGLNNPNVTSYGPFFGHDTRSVMREIAINEAIHQQVQWANHSNQRL